MKPIQQKKAPKVQGVSKRPPKYPKDTISYAVANSRGDVYTVTRDMINVQNHYTFEYIAPNESHGRLFIMTGSDKYRKGAKLYLQGLKVVLPLMRMGFTDPAELYENAAQCRRTKVLYNKLSKYRKDIESILKYI